MILGSRLLSSGGFVILGALESFTSSWWMAKRHNMGQARPWCMSLFYWPGIRTWACEMWKVAGIYNSVCAQKEKEMSNGEHIAISQLAHSSERQMCFYFSVEHLSLSHGSQPKIHPAQCSGTPSDVPREVLFMWTPMIWWLRNSKDRFSALSASPTYPYPTHHLQCTFLKDKMTASRNSRLRLWSSPARMKSCWTVLVKVPYRRRVREETLLCLWDKFLCALLLMALIGACSLWPHLKLVLESCTPWGLPSIYSFVLVPVWGLKGCFKSQVVTVFFCNICPLKMWPASSLFASRHLRVW